MGRSYCTLFILILAIFLPSSNSCAIDTVTNWLIPVTLSIQDIDRGIFYRRSTTNIEGINSVTQSEGLNGGPYLSVSHTNNEVIISTNDAYEYYENNETVESMGATVVFRCSSGSTSTLIFVIDVIDTNNNSPELLPSETYEFVIAPPVPPGFLITDCINDIIARDIDLTTERIDFEIEENSLFEISYDDTSSAPKEFKAVLKTVALIRSLPEPVILTISATDVDRTSDPRRTTYGTIKIIANSEFQFPDEPVFSKSFYMAVYTNEHELNLQEVIYLRQGYDEQIHFILQGEHSEFFDLDENGNQVNLIVKSRLTTEVLRERQIYLVVKAEREDTSGATATIIVQLPEARDLNFLELSYSGTLRNNTVTLETIILIGYTADINLTLTGDYASHFSVYNSESYIYIEVKEQLPESVISENELLLLTLSASGANTVTNFTSIFLTILKEDATTPVFERAIYFGTYVNSSTFDIENILLSQGKDDSVTFRLSGDNSMYFDINTTDDGIVIVSNSSIPEELIYTEKVILFNLIAEKPLTVGGSTVVSIRFPEELVIPTVLRYSQNTYKGELENNELILETIILESGYTSLTKFELKGEHMQHFIISNDNNIVTVELRSIIGDDVLLNNNFILLEIEASGERSVSVSTSIIIDITSTNIIGTIIPVFDKPYYMGSYTEQNGLVFNDVISLGQGYDEDITFNLEGDNSQWFSLNVNGMYVSLVLNTSQTISEEKLNDNRYFLFTIEAIKPEATTGRAAILIDLLNGTVSDNQIKFSQDNYVGYFRNNTILLDPITLEYGNINNVALELNGGNITQIVRDNGNIILELISEEQGNIIEERNILVLSLVAVTANSRTHTTIILELPKDTENYISVLNFEYAYYIGSYSESDEFQFNHEVVLIDGFDESVRFTLEGDDSYWFSINDIYETVILSQTTPIPNTVLERNKILVFTIKAENSKNVTTTTTIIIEITSEVTDTNIYFDKIMYRGLFQEGVVSHETINLFGYNGTNVAITGDYADLFNGNSLEGIVTVTAFELVTFPGDINYIALELNAGDAKSVLLLDIPFSEIANSTVHFDKILYRGLFLEGVVTHETINLSGYNGTNIEITGDYAELFSGNYLNGIVTVTEIELATFPNDINYIALELNAAEAKSVLLLNVLISDITNATVNFDKILYRGQFHEGIVTHEIINVSGYNGTNITITGAYADRFNGISANGIVLITASELITLPDDINYIALELYAAEAKSVLLLDVPFSEIVNSTVHFDKTLYRGLFHEGVVSHEAINLSGYDGTNIAITGDYAEQFNGNSVNGIVTVTPIELVTFPDDILYIVLELHAAEAKSVLLLNIPFSEITNATVHFDKILYRGHFHEGVVTHETINVSGYNGTNVDITGDYADLFNGNSLNGIVTVTAIALVTFPDDILYVALEMNAAEAKSVLLLNILSSDLPVVPLVTFSSPLYSLRAEITQTGYVGHVHASADNGEPVTYSLIVDNDHLRARVSVSNIGEINLSAPVNSGIYSFQVSASTIVSQVNASSQVSLWVDAITVCGTDIVLPPLIILDRIEEEPHRNLVVLNRTQYEGCYYSLTNRWPTDQTWLYVDEDGLHTESIDREHESIAFMAVSQIQVELVLHCIGDEVTRSKRSLTVSPNHDYLGPYDYGSMSWILTDSILYNSKRSVINLIVVDINDNAPIFIGKEKEPIYVGYPIPEIEATILPKVLIEVKATDADVGENAAIQYWSSEEILAISPQTGYVHVRNSLQLENNMRMTINATDQNGLGLTGSIDIVVKLLDTDQIAVITIQGGFLDDESSILSDLTEAVEYEINVLRTIVISDSTEGRSRKIHDKNRLNEVGTFLQLYVYGILNNEPVSVNQLTSDISNSNIVTVNIAKILSLEDHLQGQEICDISGRDTALLVTTIVLAVVLFILISAIAVWFFLKWKKNKNYDQFSDENSLASPKESLQEIPKVDIQTKPRLDMEQLRKSERRLQEMLNDSMEDIIVVNNDTGPPKETTVTIKTPEPQLPIVIQSIDKLKDNADDEDDDDEFGERKKVKRKSVVTFNENVEKIIHIEDIPESPASEFEVYKF